MLNNVLNQFHNFSIATLHLIRYGVLISVIIYFIYKSIKNFTIGKLNDTFILTVKCFLVYICWLIFELISVNYFV